MECILVNQQAGRNSLMDLEFLFKHGLVLYMKAGDGMGKDGVKVG